MWDQNSPLQIRRSNEKTHCENFDACGSSLAIHGEAILDAKVLNGSFLPSVYLELKPTVTVYAALNIGSTSMA